MKRYLKFLLVVFLPLGMFLSACNLRGTPVAMPAATVMTVPTATATLPSQVPQDVVVERIEIHTLESFSEQVQVVVYGELPDACSLIEGAEQVREGNTFQVLLVIARRVDARCSPDPMAFEHTVILDVTGLKTGAYVVNVHGARDTFELITAKAPIEGGSIGGWVWHDLCSVVGGEGRVPPSPSAGCVADGGGYRANGVLEAGEPGIEGVLITLGQGACPSTGLATAMTDAGGLYTFGDLAAGSYCVTVDPLQQPNASVLLPGSWTAPAVEQKNVTVTVSPGARWTDIDFGWDYQFLPVAQPEHEMTN